MNLFGRRPARIDVFIHHCPGSSPTPAELKELLEILIRKVDAMSESFVAFSESLTALEGHAEEINTDIDTILGQIGQGMTPEEEAQAKTRLDALRARLAEIAGKIPPPTP